MQSRLILVAIGVLFLITLSPAQKQILFTPKDLPAAVTDAFAKVYPNAKILGAGKELEKGETLYEVESLDGTTHRDLLYHADGTLYEIEETIEAKALPEAVTAALTKKFTSYKLEKAEKLIIGSSVNYEVVIGVGKKRYEIKTTPEGKILGKEESKGEDKD